jgi:murein DD-endopeptidase MepM/ murein hydrolase activator NlpD
MESGAVVSAAPAENIGISSPDNSFGQGFIENGAMVAAVGASGSVRISEGGLTIYRVAKGDTIAAIAAKFGISASTVIWANKLSTSSHLAPGQELTILPASGVLYTAKDGDTVNSIAAIFKSNPADVVAFINGRPLKDGDAVVIRNAKPVRGMDAGANLPDASGYLAMPVKDGLNWGQLHGENAVDIAAPCGAPIYAAAEGLVVDIGNPDLWNGGLGGYIRISHPLGSIETLYAHTSVDEVAVGDYISKGEEIGKVGSTGQVDGATGCHIHFGVDGAKNPFAK